MSGFPNLGGTFFQTVSYKSNLQKERNTRIGGTLVFVPSSTLYFEIGTADGNRLYQCIVYLKTVTLIIGFLAIMIPLVEQGSPKNARNYCLCFIDFPIQRIKMRAQISH